MKPAPANPVGASPPVVRPWGTQAPDRIFKAMPRCGAWARKHRKWRGLAPFGLLIALASTCTFADRREDFLTAEAALKTGDIARFERLAEGLQDYPLYPYLLFQRLKRNLDRASSNAVEAFLEAYEDTPLAGRIRSAWLDRLAARERWHDYLTAYRPDGSAERRCRFLNALITTGRGVEALPQVGPLWLVGRSQPPACDPVFAAWRDAGRLTPDLVWQRIDLALEANQPSLARYLGRFLPPAERVWLEAGMTLLGRPEDLLRPGSLPTEHPRRGHFLAHALGRLARRSPQQAADALDRLERRGELTAASAQKAAAAVGLAMAEDGMEEGLAYLERVPAGTDNTGFQERRLRAALSFGAWSQVAAWVQSMPKGTRKSEHWVYWQARAHEALGEPDNAQRLYGEAARERSLWGFLAAERLGLPYRFDHRPIPVSEEDTARIENSAAGRRITELRALGRPLDLRRELYHLTRHAGPDDLKALAVLARRWGWPDQAIFILAKSGYWDDLDLRFPILHRDIVSERARAVGLEASWVYAVLRQESAFNPQAVSPAGAIGLMQLMPATARAVARSLGRSSPTRSDLFDPARNITLGSRYLGRMRDRFDDHPALAAAAYNAGPSRVEKWLPTRSMDADIWTAIIPFRETRTYVRRVLAYRVIYDHRLGRTIEPLLTSLPPVSRGAVLSGAKTRPFVDTEG
jgi:soluble lytic murein transglycosylase